MVDIHSEEYILGQNIRKYRLRLGWSQADLSNAVDIDRADISKYENGAKGIMSSTLLRSPWRFNGRTDGRRRARKHSSFNSRKI